MPARYWFLGLVIGAGLLGWYATAGRRIVATPALAPVNIMTVSTAATVTPHALGNAGCSAQGCHGAVTSHARPLSIWGTDAADLSRWRESATIFTGHDPHRLAFDALKTERSAGIQHLLQAKTPAWEDARCLACHANPTTASNPSASAKALHADGVSCEACHGNSSDWIVAHTKFTGWPTRWGEHVKAGMTYLENIAMRAITCVRCHVGAPADDTAPRRDVTHDLIAAGHPRLNFDFATAVERLPSHWVEKDRYSPQPALRPSSEAAWHWGVGRRAGAEAAYRLLADRVAQGREDSRTWPELAEYDCFSCHRGLDPERNKFSPALTRRKGGLGREAPPLLHAVEENIPRTEALETMMRRPALSPADAETLALAAAEEWSEKLWGLANFKPNPQEDLRSAKKLAAAELPITWTEACQRFYALDYLNRMGKRGLDKEVGEILPLLQFQRDPVEINSPATADLPLAGRKLRAIAERLAQPSPPAEPAKK